ncbi:hypothetical protein DFH06DRAFT_1142523 [Mycena polygramma]|nr:hypothetical protein DFH06DRAFT_1142523 [Mycena polygramma]
MYRVFREARYMPSKCAGSEQNVPGLPQNIPAVKCAGSPSFVNPDHTPMSGGDMGDIVILSSCCNLGKFKETPVPIQHPTLFREAAPGLVAMRTRVAPKLNFPALDTARRTSCYNMEAQMVAAKARGSQMGAAKARGLRWGPQRQGVSDGSQMGWRKAQINSATSYLYMAT